MTPGFGAVWLSDDFVDYYTGVRPGEALPGRPAYRGRSTINRNASLGLSRSAGGRTSVRLGAEVEWLGEGITDSPIVDQDRVVTVFGGVGFRIR